MLNKFQRFKEQYTNKYAVFLVLSICYRPRRNNVLVTRIYLAKPVTKCDTV